MKNIAFIVVCVEPEKPFNVPPRFVSVYFDLWFWTDTLFPRACIDDMTLDCVRYNLMEREMDPDELNDVDLRIWTHDRLRKKFLEIAGFEFMEICSEIPIMTVRGCPGYDRSRIGRPKWRWFKEIMKSIVSSNSGYCRVSRA